MNDQSGFGLASVGKLDENGMVHAPCRGFSPCYTSPEGMVWCCVVLCCAVLCCAVLCCAVLCCGVVWCAVVCCGVVWCDVVWCDAGTVRACATCEGGTAGHAIGGVTASLYAFVHVSEAHTEGGVSAAECALDANSHAYVPSTRVQHTGCAVVWCGVVCSGVVRGGVVWHGVVWRGVVWCAVVCCGVLWCGVV